ncbi:MAG: hypothetical protein HY890_07980 [Deltaproteobacteria bacterium]|nr:hypothetical protein [Deltaproteobacteria bacterium]
MEPSNKNITISGEAEQIVLCRMVRPKSLRTLEACKACEHHRGIEELRPEGQLGLPASYMVYCGLPSKEMVIDLIRES